MRINQIHLNIMKAIGSTEETTFGEFCGALGDDKPEEKDDWANLFRTLDRLEKEELVEIERTNGKIDTLILTQTGAALLR